MIDDEFDVFYDTAEFAVVCTVQPAGVPFGGILATVDDERFGGQVMAGVHSLQYPTAAADLRKGDDLNTQFGTEPVKLWEVLRSPDRIVDGRESLALLTPRAA